MIDPCGGADDTTVPYARPGRDRLNHWVASLQGRFACEEHLSSTNSSWVFRGKDLRSGHEVAIKILRDSTVGSHDAFIAEALLLSELEHPGIVRYIAHGELEEGGAYLVTEWMKGEDLHHLLQRRSLSPAESVALVIFAADALAASHARGIVHLDLKPGNIFLADGDLSKIRLLDFGIARLTRSANSDPEEGVISGTPGYMAPEQVLGEPISPATDIFALGAVLFRCVTGRKIFAGEPLAVMQQTSVEEAPRTASLVGGLHPALDELIANMLAMSPAHRPADAAALLSAVVALPADVLATITPQARVLLNPGGLTSAERVPLTVVLVRRGDQEPAGTPTETLDWPRQYSSCFETLADGTWIALPRGNATALDQALHAARLTLDVRSGWPKAAIAIAAGRTVDGGVTRLHEVVAEAEALLSVARPGQILLDGGSAGLVESSFALAPVQTASCVELLGAKKAAVAPNHLDGESVVCLGRDVELASLAEAADEAFTTSTARTVLVTAPAGMGKSHLVREFLATFQRGAPLNIWSGQGDSMTARSPFVVVSALLATAGIPAQSASLARLLRPGQGAEIGQGRAMQSGSVDDIHRAFAQSLGAELARGPLALHLEDIHWADLGSLRAIDYALATLSDRPLLIVATARPEVHDLFPDLWQRRSMKEIRLRELDERDVDRLIAMRLGAGVAAHTRARIVQRARGNVFLLHELIRAEAEGRGDEMPETALGVVQSRLRLFDPHARRLLRAASILGESFTLQGLTRLLGDEPNQTHVKDWLDWLSARDVVRRRGDGSDGAEMFAFSHALVRDAAYDMLTESDRKLGHGLAARWLEGAGRGHPVVVAQHFERAGDGADAGRCYLRATIEAFEIGDFVATTRAAEQALGFELSANDRGHAQALAADAYRLVGNVEQSARLSAEALRTLSPNTPLWRQVARTAMMAGASGFRHRDS